MDWPWSPFLHGDGGCSWQGTPKEQTPKTSTPEFLGNWNGKWRITKTLGCPFLPVWMQRGSCSCFGKPGCGDSEFLSLNWWPWAQHLKNCCKCCNSLCGWGCIWESLCLYSILLYFILLYFIYFIFLNFLLFPFILIFILCIYFIIFMYFILISLYCMLLYLFYFYFNFYFLFN